MIGLAIAIGLGSLFALMLTVALLSMRSPRKGQVLVVTGPGCRTRGLNGVILHPTHFVVEKGSVFPIPLLQKLKRIDIRDLDLYAPNVEATSNDGIPMVMSIRGRVTFLTEMPDLVRSTDRLLEGTREDIIRSCNHILSECAMDLIRGKRATRIHENRFGFCDHLKLSSKSRILELGLQVSSLELTEVRDTQGHIEERESMKRERRREKQVVKSATRARDEKLRELEGLVDDDIETANSEREPTVLGFGMDGAPTAPMEEVQEEFREPEPPPPKPEPELQPEPPVPTTEEVEPVSPPSIDRDPTPLGLSDARESDIPFEAQHGEIPEDEPEAPPSETEETLLEVGGGPFPIDLPIQEDSIVLEPPTQVSVPLGEKNTRLDASEEKTMIESGGEEKVETEGPEVEEPLSDLVPTGNEDNEISEPAVPTEENVEPVAPPTPMAEMTLLGLDTDAAEEARVMEVLRKQAQEEEQRVKMEAPPDFETEATILDRKNSGDAPRPELPMEEAPPVESAPVEEETPDPDAAARTEALERLRRQADIQREAETEAREAELRRKADEEAAELAREVALRRKVEEQDARRPPPPPAPKLPKSNNMKDLIEQARAKAQEAIKKFKKDKTD